MTPLARRAAVAIPLTLALDALFVASTVALPDRGLRIPWEPPALLALLLAASGVVVLVMRLPRGWLWPSSMALPAAIVATAALIEDSPQVAPMIGNLTRMAASWAWAATGWAVILAVWLGVPARRFLGYAAAVGLKVQVVALGIQFMLIPGIVLFVFLGMLEIVAVRDHQKLLPVATVEAAGRWPLAWATAIGAGVVSAAAGTSVLFLWGVDFGVGTLLQPQRGNFPAHYLSAVVQSVIHGGGIALAASLLDESPAGAEPPGAGADRDAWSPPGAT